MMTMNDDEASQPDPVSTHPRIVMRGRKVRHEILDAVPAFLDPARFPREKVYHAAVVVLIGFAHGSTTAARLMELRQRSDPTWPKLERNQALDYLDFLYQYFVD